MAKAQPQPYCHFFPRRSRPGLVLGGARPRPETLKLSTGASERDESKSSSRNASSQRSYDSPASAPDAPSRGPARGLYNRTTPAQTYHMTDATGKPLRRSLGDSSARCQHLFRKSMVYLGIVQAFRAKAGNRQVPRNAIPTGSRCLNGRS